MTTTAAARRKTGLVAPGAERASGTWAARLRRAWRDHQAYRSTLAELSALSDQELGDIGLRRETLKQTARRAVYGT